MRCSEIFSRKYDPLVKTQPAVRPADNLEMPTPSVQQSDNRWSRAGAGLEQGCLCTGDITRGRQRVLDLADICHDESCLCCCETQPGMEKSLAVGEL